MKYFIPIFALVLIAAGVSYFFLMGKPSSSNMQGAPISDQKMDEEDSMMAEGSDQYITEYSKEAFEKAKDQKRVLFFYANWCPTCRPANIEFMKNLSKFPEDVVIFRINYNDSDTDETEKALANQYKITYQHTFVQVDENGEVLARWNGGGISELKSKLK